MGFLYESQRAVPVASSKVEGDVEKISIQLALEG